MAPGGLTSNQKALFGLAALLCGPALLKRIYEKPSSVDLSSFAVVARPAIERHDSTVRIEFCRS